MEKRENSTRKLEPVFPRAPKRKRMGSGGEWGREGQFFVHLRPGGGRGKKRQPGGHRKRSSPSDLERHWNGGGVDLSAQELPAPPSSSPLRGEATGGTILTLSATTGTSTTSTHPSTHQFCLLACLSATPPCIWHSVEVGGNRFLEPVLALLRHNPFLGLHASTDCTVH